MGDIIDTHNRIFRSKRLKTNLNSIVTKNSPWRLHAYIYPKITHTNVDVQNKAGKTTTTTTTKLTSQSWYNRIMEWYSLERSAKMSMSNSMQNGSDSGSRLGGGTQERKEEQTKVQVNTFDQWEECGCNNHPILCDPHPWPLRLVCV